MKFYLDTLVESPESYLDKIQECGIKYTLKKGRLGMEVWVEIESPEQIVALKDATSHGVMVWTIDDEEDNPYLLIVDGYLD